MTLLCGLCWHPMDVQGEVPMHCPHCHREPPRWVAGQASPTATAEAIKWSADDRRFLRSIRISAE